MNYAALKTAITGYLHRGDLSTVVEDKIALAEAMLFRELEIPATETEVTGTTSGGTITLPVDFGRPVRLTIVVGSVTYTLDYYSAAVEQSTTGVPSSYRIEQDQIVLQDAPADAYGYTLVYIPDLSPLSGTNTSNWLLAHHPDLYLYAGALECARHVRNDREIDKLTKLLEGDPAVPSKPGLLDSVRSKVKRRTLPARGPLQIKPRR